MTAYCLFSGPEYDENATFHQKLVFLLGKNLFKICHWAKLWYIQCQYRFKHLIW